MGRNFVIFLFVFTAGAYCRRFPRHLIYGKCYDIVTPPALDLSTWATGRWFELRRYNNFFEGNSDCASHVYFLNAENKNIDSTFNFRSENGSLALIQGQVNYTITENEIDLSAIYPDDSSPSTFDILATDIANYAIVYSCWQVSNDTYLPEKQERLWVLSRQTSMTNETQETVKNALIVNGTDLGRYLFDVPQENCP